MKEHNLVNETSGSVITCVWCCEDWFCEKFKEVNDLKTQTRQYTDLDEAQQKLVEAFAQRQLTGSLESSYLETAKQLRKIQQKKGMNAPEDIRKTSIFEFVLFCLCVIEITITSWKLDCRSARSKKPSKQRMTQSPGDYLLKSNSNLMGRRRPCTEYIKQVIGSSPRPWWTKTETLKPLGSKVWQRTWEMPIKTMVCQPTDLKKLCRKR